jgi:hypothetical protein
MRAIQSRSYVSYWAYLDAEKRLSNEFDDTIGWAPATRLLAGC